MTDQYLVEALQCLGVAWFVAIIALGPQWSRSTLLAHLLGASAFAMLAKVSSPLYCALPGLASLWLLVSPRASHEVHVSVSRRWVRFVGLSVSLILSTATLAWYILNWGPLTGYLRDASSGSVAAYYGLRTSFLGKLTIWLQAGVASFSYPSIVPVLVVVSVVAVLVLVAFVRESRRRSFGRLEWLHITVIVSIGEIVVTLCIFSFQVNQDPRYLLPLAPYIGLLLAVALAKLAWRELTLVVAGAFLIQWGLVYEQALNLTGTAPPDPAVNRYLVPVQLNDQNLEDVDAAVNATCPPEQADGLNVVGVDVYWFSENALSFESAKHADTGDGRCFYVSLSFAETDPDAAWAQMMSRNVSYFIALDPVQYSVPDDFRNRVDLQILDRVRTSPLFTAVPLDGHPRVLIFKRNQVDVKNGTFVRGSGENIYLIEKGERRVFPNMPTFLSYGGLPDLSNTVVLADEELLGVPQGTPIPPR